MRTVEVEICAGTACHLMGAPDLSSVLEQLCTADRERISLRFTHCLGVCGQGPNAKIDGQLHSGLTAESMLMLLRDRLGRTTE